VARKDVNDNLVFIVENVVNFLVPKGQVACQGPVVASADLGYLIVLVQTAGANEKVLFTLLGIMQIKLDPDTSIGGRSAWFARR
jgi:hypothetical protein